MLVTQLRLPPHSRPISHAGIDGCIVMFAKAPPLTLSLPIPALSHPPSHSYTLSPTHLLTHSLTRSLTHSLLSPSLLSHSLGAGG